MLDAYDFSGIRVLADIGGGNGSVLTAVLKQYPDLRGILFDLPGVAERAKAQIEPAGLAGRCQVIGGSFFEAVLTPTCFGTSSTIGTTTRPPSPPFPDGSPVSA